MKKLAFIWIALIIAACTPKPQPTPDTLGTMSSPGVTTNLPNRIVDGPLPGCADAFELRDQTLVLPPLQVTFDAGNIIDRVGVVTSGATYTYSIRPVKPISCNTTSLPPLKMPTVTFGFNYLGDYSKNNPLCINGSSIEFTNFTISGTPLDKIVERIAHEMVWKEVDLQVVKILHPFFIGGSVPVSASPRCSNWVDLSTL